MRWIYRLSLVVVVKLTTWMMKLIQVVGNRLVKIEGRRKDKDRAVESSISSADTTDTVEAYISRLRVQFASLGYNTSIMSDLDIKTLAITTLETASVYGWDMAYQACKASSDRLNQFYEMKHQAQQGQDSSDSSDGPTIN